MSKTMGFTETKDDNQNTRWDYAKGNNKGGNSNFLINPRWFEFLPISCVLHESI
jgi:hypothetical protein